MKIKKEIKYSNTIFAMIKMWYNIAIFSFIGTVVFVLPNYVYERMNMILMLKVFIAMTITLICINQVNDYLDIENEFKKKVI